ncbi:preprotein translocase subunit YajC [Streptococcus cameli]
MEQLLFPVLMLAMVGFMFYSQRKQQKNRMETLNQIKKGDEIVTIGGLYGIVDELTEDKVVLDVDGVYLTFDRSAIRNRVTAATAPVVDAAETPETPETKTESAIEE